jgi:hypothetical protein
MTAERFMAQDAPRPLDEEEVREAVWELLFTRVPPALVRVLGRQAYARRAATASPRPRPPFLRASERRHARARGARGAPSAGRG